MTFMDGDTLNTKTTARENPQPTVDECLANIDKNTCAKLEGLSETMQAELGRQLEEFEKKCAQMRSGRKRKAYEALLLYCQSKLERLQGNATLAKRWYDLTEEFKIDVAHPITPDDLLKAMRQYNGYRYKLGAKGEKNEIDCSGLITKALGDLNVAQGRWMSADGLYERCSILKNIAENPPQKGDFVFWIALGEPKPGKATHVAIVNEVLEDGRVRVTQSAGSLGGFDENHIIDPNAKKTMSGKSKYAFGRPVFYG